MKINKLKLLTVGLVMSLMVGCSTTSPSSDVKGESGGDKVLVYGSDDYTSINPALYEHGEINSLIFTGLTMHDKDNKVVPALAESWEYDKDTFTYTFKLRQDVLWHDGEKFTAEDVKFTIEAIQNPENNSEIATNYEEITHIEVVNDYEVKITLNQDNVAILEYLTVGILPKHVLENQDITTGNFNQKPIGTGPFELTNWDMGQSITLEKNEDYFEGDPKLDKVVFKIIPDDNAKAMQLKSGEIDVAQVTPKDMEMFDGDGNFNTYVMNTADYRGIMYDFKVPLFKDNKEVIEAISYAIDKQAIVDGVLLGKGEVAYSPLQAGGYNNPDIEKYDYNKDKAVQILEENGWELNSDNIYQKGNQKAEFRLTCMEGDQVRIDMANICAQQLKEVGIKANVEVQSDVDWDNLEGFLIGWGSPFDPDDHTYKVFSTDAGSNLNSYSNAKIDELLKNARSTDVEEDRQKYYKEFQEEFSKDLPFTMLAYIDSVYVAKSNITSIDDSKVLGHHGVGILWNIHQWDKK